jgi:hypothetical protein
MEGLTVRRELFISLAALVFLACFGIIVITQIL